MLVQFTLLICHKIHHGFLSVLSEKVPNFPVKIEQEYGHFLVWSFIVLGFFGLSFQIAFIIDLINILTLPTKIIFGFLRVVYKNCIELIGKLYEFISQDKKKWITCPYPLKLINSNFRTSTFGILLIIFNITIFTSFYYLWLGIIIVFLTVLEVFLCLSKNSI